MKIRSEIFQSSFRSWKSLCEEATKLIPAENLINISHSCDHEKGASSSGIDPTNRP